MVNVVEKTIIFDSSGSSVIAQDVSDFVVHEQSLWNSTTRPDPPASSCGLSMKRTGSGNPLVREGFRIINGFWDLDSSQFILARFGGYIRRLRRTQQANVLRFNCDLVDYTRYLTHRRIVSWPTGPDPPYEGFPVPSSVARWFWGEAGEDGIPYPGLFTAHYTGMRTDGVDPIFSSIDLSPVAQPGNLGTHYGMYGFCNMLTAVSDILAATAFIYQLDYSGPQLTPAVWVQAALSADGQDIVPQIRVGNVADVLHTPVGTLMVVDEPGGLLTDAAAIWQPYAHEREICEANNVTILGEGGDPTIAGNPLVWAEATTPDHDARYLAEFSTEGRWDLVETQSQIYTIATAQIVATAVETESGAGSGAYEATSDQLFPAGEWVRLIKSDELVDGLFPIRAVEMIRAGTHPRYQYRVGFDVRTARSILGSGGIQSRLTIEELNYKLGRLRAVPGRPTSTAATRHPMHSQENDFQARSYNKTLARFKASANAPWDGDPDGADPASLMEFYDSTGQRQMHAGPDGEPRGHSLIIAKAVYAAPLKLLMAQTKTFIRRVEDVPSGHWTFQVKVGTTTSAVTLPFTVHDGNTLILTPPSTSAECALTLTELPSPPATGGP